MVHSDVSAIAPAHRTLTQWLQYLESIHPTAIDLGLERCQQVADKLGLDFAASTVITVAGTNGKGTTCAFLEQTAIEQGKSVAVYSSPHLLSYRERVRVNGKPAADAAFCEAFTAVDEARGDISLTYFEFGTLAALVMMYAWQPDVVILEVGLGGRLDATNIITPNLAVITTIDLDHQDWLGDTRDKIAVEKAGIMRPGIKAVIGEREPPASLLAEVERFQADAVWAGQDFNISEHSEGWQWQLKEHKLTQLPYPGIPLQNAATAIAALYQLGWLQDREALTRIISRTSLPGRRQQLQEAPRVVVDVGHNPQATANIRRWLKDYQYDNLYIVAGMLKDKSVAATLAPFEGLHAQWLLAGTSGPRGLDGESLQAVLPETERQNSATFAQVVDAYQHARTKCSQSDMILVFGSFLTVADVLALHTEKFTD
ncbi:bifunctional tetrahydrofolate synthase/dihydrofolate synthase [Alteromonas sp. ASW11-19]|uniref:Dihydrofolate synthase/folylpolyglutamate synthase n=1 Tax=Alteromonas salexigens TaxID=2982530 RepID=A0ABT2VUM7_9ALTE|nr:bifunctional tetrahydrofolate synthase/dihydrofolate synthase [Alteromonas salexigens]MCU7555926.1 bifunctional tetrahydrofolate synthase/dihydrofolate synthase [Alteromonas salexigens]